MYSKQILASSRADVSQALRKKIAIGMNELCDALSLCTQISRNEALVYFCNELLQLQMQYQLLKKGGT